MPTLNFEEKGLLRILGRIEAGELDIDPVVRYALLRRGLLERSTGMRLSAQGQQLLDQLRSRVDRNADRAALPVAG